jgi:phosphatidylglycerophosphate synthase
MDKKLISIEKTDKKHTLKKVLVNSITAIRALGTLVIVPIFKTSGPLTAGLAAAGFFVTDFIDGKLARKLKVQSFFGSLLDSLSDKAFAIICLTLLALQNPIFWTVIAAEGAIVYANYRSAQKGNNIQSSKAGKIKTGVLGVSIIGSMMCLEAPTIREILKFTNSAALDKIFSLDPNLLTTLLAIPAIAASCYVLKDYISISNKQTEAKAKKTEEKTMEITSSDIEQTIADIEAKKAELEGEKEKIKQLKSSKEILHDLFDTEFYLEHKDDDIKQLLYK